MDSASKKLLDALTHVVNKEGLDWIRETLGMLMSSSDIENDLALASAMARRKLGTAELGERFGNIDNPYGTLDISTWESGNAGRVILLLEVTCSHSQEAIKIITTAFRYGDEIERATIIRALILFPNPESLKQVALEAGRINSLSLYTALAENNPYPAAFYTEHEFNHLIMKALFTGISISSVYGLQHRTNQELSRMCEDYIVERLDAKRPVPPDIWLAAYPFLSKHGNKLMRMLESDDPSHRKYIQLAAQG